MSFSRDSIGLNLFLVACLVSAVLWFQRFLFRLACLRPISSLHCLLVVLVAKAVVMVVAVVLVGVSGGGSNESSQFREFPEAVYLWS